MKKIFAFVVAAMLCITGVALVGCGNEDEPVVKIDEIHIVAPASSEIKAGEKFTLDYTTMPETAADKIKVDWQISDSHRLSYSNGEFTALTCGTVKVTANVKGNEATDEIELKVVAPDGFTEYAGTGYKLVRPSNWTAGTLGTVRTWTAANGTTNMNITTETLNAAYFSAPASSFQTAIESTYGLLGYTVDFAQSVTVKKNKYLGIERVQVNYAYSLTKGGSTSTYHQTQMIINNAQANKSCVLTVTFLEEDFDEDAAKLQETIFSQFMPD